MKIIGNKTHGDLTEIGIAEFINQFMYDFKASHVGKDEHEKDFRELKRDIEYQKSKSNLKSQFLNYARIFFDRFSC